MDRGFRLLLRTALVLVLLAGVGLVVHAIVSEGPGDSSYVAPARNVTPPPGLVQDSAASPAAPSPSASQTQPAADGNQAAPPEGRHDPGYEVEVGKFIAALRGNEGDRTQATVAGQKGTPREEHYEVVGPVVDLATPVADTGPVDVQFRNVRITANNGRVAIDLSSCQLSEDVTACGEGYTISTKSAAYSARSRMLTSKDPVRIEAQPEGAGNSGAKALVLTGEGLEVDVAAQKMRIIKSVRARFVGVSEDLLAARTGADAPPTEVRRDIEITCSGTMDYEHLGRRVVFQDSVRAVSDTRTLTCDRLTIHLGKPAQTDSVQVEQIEAVGNVWLQHEGLSARGSNLAWNQVTQTGVVTGQPGAEAIISTAEAELSGRELTLFRVNERIQSKGAGQLYWKARPASASAAPPAEPDSGSPFGFNRLALNGGKPVTVTWQKSMTYDRGKDFASFTGSVVVIQDSFSLDCDELLLRFSKASEVLQVQADGSVKLHDGASEPNRDVLCEHMLWDGEKHTVDLTAPEGGVVTVVAREGVISSARVTLDDKTGLLSCPAPGTLLVAPEGRERADGSKEEIPPLTVQWKQRMDFHERPTAEATFKGDVLAVRAGQRTQCQSLKVEFAAGMKDVLRAEAGDGAVIDLRTEPKPAEKENAPSVPGVGPVAADNWQIAAQQVVILPQKKMLTCATPGTLTVMDAEKVTGRIAWQKSMEVCEPDGSANFQGQTRADMEGAVLESESLTLEFNPDDHQMRSISALGGVHFVSGTANGWDVRSESGMAVFDAAGDLRQIIAQGNVKVEGIQYTLTSDMLTLHTAPTAADPDSVEVVRAEAKRNVRVTYRRETDVQQADGDLLVWELKNDLFVLTGKPTASAYSGGQKIASEKLEFDRTTGRLRTGRRVRTEGLTDPF